MNETIIDDPEPADKEPPAFHDAGLDASVTAIRMRRTSGNDASAVLMAMQQVVKVSESSKLSILQKLCTIFSDNKTTTKPDTLRCIISSGLFQDHNSTYAVKQNSVEHCMTLTNKGTEDQSPPKNAQIKPCRLVVCNQSAYGEVMKHATANLIMDGMQLDLKLKSENGSITEDVQVQYEPITAMGKAIEAVFSVMEKVNNALYKGDVYRKV